MDSLAASLDHGIGAVAACCEASSDAEREAVFAGNAHRVYRLLGTPLPDGGARD